MRSPAFQFYPADYLSDMKVRMLSWASRGLYMELICYCWREGWIPSDSSAIAQLTGCHDLAIVEPCLSLFISHADDPSKLIHKRLDAERKKQFNHSNERSESGKKGAETRWGKGKDNKKTSDSLANSSAIKQPIAKNSSSSSFSTSLLPPNPQGGLDGDLTPKPKRPRRLTSTQKRNTKIEANTPTMTRIGGWFGRLDTTLWTVAEAESLSAINPTDKEIAGMEAYYAADHGDKDIRRRDLITLLNNWQSELDRAREWWKKNQ